MRSNLQLKYLGLVLILIAFAGTSIHLGYSQMDTFEFSIVTDKSEYLLGEPVAVDFNLKNISPDVVDTEVFPPYDRGTINIMITQSGNDPTDFISEKMTVGMTKILFIPAITLNPGESTTSTEFISFNLFTDNLAFPVPDEYQIQAILRDGEDRILKSNIVNIIVTGVTGMDANALSCLEENGLLMFLTPEIQSSPESLDPNLINKANECLANFPVSIYSDFLSSALAAIAEVPIPECPPGTIGTYPECEPAAFIKVTKQTIPLGASGPFDVTISSSNGGTFTESATQTLLADGAMTTWTVQPEKFLLRFYQLGYKASLGF